MVTFTRSFDRSIPRHQAIARQIFAGQHDDFKPSPPRSIPARAGSDPHYPLGAIEFSHSHGQGCRIVIDKNHILYPSLEFIARIETARSGRRATRAKLGGETGKQTHSGNATCFHEKSSLLLPARDIGRRKRRDRVAGHTRPQPRSAASSLEANSDALRIFRARYHLAGLRRVKGRAVSYQDETS